jgi:hypothetical protein
MFLIFKIGHIAEKLQAVCKLQKKVTGAVFFVTHSYVVC